MRSCDRPPHPAPSGQSGARRSPRLPGAAVVRLHTRSSGACRGTARPYRVERSRPISRLPHASANCRQRMVTTARTRVPIDDLLSRAERKAPRQNLGVKAGQRAGREESVGQPYDPRGAPQLERSVLLTPLDGVSTLRLGVPASIACRRVSMPTRIRSRNRVVTSH